METAPERSKTPCSNNVKRLSRANGFRKALGSLPSNTNWNSEMPPRIRQTSSNYGRDFSSDHNLKSPEAKSSDDFIPDLEINEINYPDYGAAGRKRREITPRDLNYKTGIKEGIEVSLYREDDDHLPVNLVPQRDESATNEYRFNGGNIPQAIMAEEKLKKLKELQRKREFTERYYSQEIRKLISEYYRSAGNSGDSKNDKEDKTTVQQQICTLAKDKIINPLKTQLEPCGTMTTITRLDCGCMQETTRPIFTTSQGKVENRNCRHGQNPALLKLQASSNPQEHLSSSNCAKGRKISSLNSSRIKHRPGIDPRIVQTRTTSCGISCKRTQGSNLPTNSAELRKQAGLRRPETASSSFLRDNPENRNHSPLRKYSDTSTD